MRGDWKGRVALLVALIIVGLTLISAVGTVGAQEDSRIDIEWESEYNGISDDGNQAITLSVTLTAEQTTGGITVDFDESNSFIDSDSYAVTVAESNWENPFDGRYVIEELDSGDTITFTFDVYPRVLDQESLVIAGVNIDAENPQTYQQSADIDANLTSSPWIQYQDELSEDTGGESLSLTLIVGGVLFGFVGVVVAGYFWYSKRTAIREKHESGNELFDELHSKVGSAAKQEVEKKQDEWNEDGDDGPDIDELS